MSTLIETLAVLEPITMMIAIFGLFWVLLPLLRRQPTWLLVLLVLYPVVARINEAIAEPTRWNIAIAAAMATLPFVLIYKGRERGPELNRATRDTGVPE